MEVSLREIVALGRECERVMNDLKGAERDEGLKLEMPMNWPPYASIKEAAKLFGIGYETMRLFEHRYGYDGGFPSVRIGAKILIDVPGLYFWLKERRGEKLEIGDGTEE